MRTDLITARNDLVENGGVAAVADDLGTRTDHACCALTLNEGFLVVLGAGLESGGRDGTGDKGLPDLVPITVPVVRCERNALMEVAVAVMLRA